MHTRTDRRPIGRQIAQLTAVGLIVVAVGAIATSLGGPAAAEPSPGCVVDTTGIIGWWRGEDDLAAQIGVPLQGTVAFDDGQVGRGISFDTSSDVFRPDLTSVSDGVTVEMWVRPTDLGFTGRTQALATRWDFPSTDDSARSYSLMLSPNSDLIWETDETSTRRPEVLSAAVPSIFDGEFHHVAATWNQVEIALYFDGVQVAIMPSQGGTLNPTPTTPFRLGSTTGGSAGFRYTGLMDEATLWGRALTSAEVAAISTSGASGKCTFVPVEQATLVASSAAENNRFGRSVGIDGTTIVVGAPFSNAATVFAGAAYVYTLNGSTWSEQAALLASDAGLVDVFGWSVDIDGDTIVIGSYGNNGGGADSGAAYVFTRTGTTWTQQAKLLANDAGPGDGFGYSVTIDGDTIAVGAPFDSDAGTDTGSAYVFTRTGTTWSQQAKIVGTDTAIGDEYGASIAITGDSVIVGSPSDDDAGSASGSSYVFNRTGTTWSQQAKLLAPDGAVDDSFGYSVAIDASTALVGAPSDDDAGSESGSAYVFTRSGVTWSNQSKIVAEDAGPDDRLGVSVAVEGATAVVGAPRNSAVGGFSGAAYVFNRSGTTWRQLVKLVAASSATGDEFGNAVAVSGRIAIGSLLDDNAGYNSGSVFVFAP